MNKTHTYQGKVYVKQDKRAVKSQIKRGMWVGFLIPCNLRLGGFTVPGVVSFQSIAEFEAYCNEFTYYNCNNETGLYTHFYKLAEN